MSNYFEGKRINSSTMNISLAILIKSSRLLVKLCFFNLDNMKKRPLKGTLECVLRGVASAASYCPKQQALAHKLPAYLIADQLSPLPDTLQSLINHVTPLLMFPHRSVQIAAFHILRR